MIGHTAIWTTPIHLIKHARKCGQALELRHPCLNKKSNAFLANNVPEFLGMIQRLAQGGILLNREAACGYPAADGHPTVSLTVWAQASSVAENSLGQV